MLAAGAPGCLCLALVLGPAAFVFIEWGRTERVTKSGTFPVAQRFWMLPFPVFSVSLVFMCTLPSEGFKAFLWVSIQPATVDP